MKPATLRMVLLPAALILLNSVQSYAQDTLKSASANATKQDSAQYSDTSFVSNAINRHILEYQIAEMALQEAKRPKIKELAREIMESDRETLRHLLAKHGNANVEGVSQQQLDSIMKEVQQKKTYSNKEQVSQGVTGNTVNEDLGSGSSGSGNVRGDDTGTLSRTRSDERNANYTGQGDYAYNGKSFLADLETVGKSKGNEFENQWLDVMLRMQNEKINTFTLAASQSKNGDVRGAALAGLPRTRMIKDMLVRISRNKTNARSIDPNGQTKMGDDNINRKNANDKN